MAFITLDSIVLKTADGQTLQVEKTSDTLVLG